ncbi:MAG: 3,4-dihydroxy-2-butanone-4-phosphate synthase [Rhodobacteraceae bacterium]|nr:3,4-dihydroxy-2-butanone-4-phosphate synthase [Paracoccaceae bacterium]
MDLSGAISSVEEIVADARNGKLVILADSEDRENEGDLIIPAQMATPNTINFMATHGRGLICLSLTEERIEALGLELMASKNSSRHETAFTVSIEARDGVTTGISAHDRARTVLVAIDPQSGPEDIATPGHVFPLRSQRGGVLVRAGHTEASIDVARLAGLNPSAVICEILNQDGTMARMPDLIEFSRRHDIRVGTISDLIAYRLQHDNLVREVSSRTVQSRHGGTWELRIFEDESQGSEHIVLTKGKVSDGEPVLVRVHALNPLADVLAVSPFESHKISGAMTRIEECGRGVLVLLRDINPKLQIGDAESPQTLRQYGLGAQILASLGIRRMILLSNSPIPRIIAIEGHGLEIEGTMGICSDG